MVFISIHNWEQIDRKDADDMPTMFEASSEDNTPSPTPNSKNSKRFSKFVPENFKKFKNGFKVNSVQYNHTLITLFIYSVNFQANLVAQVLNTMLNIKLN